MAPIGEGVFATLLMNDAYLPGAMVLGHSLRDRGAKAKMVVLVTIDNVSQETISELRTIYNDIVPVQRIDNKQPANLYVMNRPDLISTFTKIELWRQTRFKRIVYLDADMVVLRAPNELLRLNTDFAAVPDIGWPDCFNSGMMVLNPNMGDYYSLLALAQRGISFDGADQGLLNMHFREWERLSFTYNCTPSGNYQYIPAYRHFQSSINAVHFIGPDKPWTLGRENPYNTGVYGDLMAMWWAVYDRHYRHQTAAYYSGQSLTAPKNKVRDYVRGEETIYPSGYSSSQPQQPQQAPPVVVSGPSGEPPAEQPMGDAPTPVEQRRFSAPHVEWEPTRAPPPANSKPEASNFPGEIYQMSSDTKLFQPPAQYPEAPRDMWYQLPEKPKEAPKPKPIFPWEGRAPKPTRVFAEPRAPSPPREPAPEAVPEPETAVEPETAAAPEPTAFVSSPPQPATMASPDPWAGFQARSNAWDDIPEIERYVQAFQGPRKAPVQVVHRAPGQQEPAQSPSGRGGRKPSIRLTDFPTEVERPSLPVTPAPIRRPSFWGSERDEEGNLPAAEGVPKQEEWNPIAKLEELQRNQSEVLMSPTKLEEKLNSNMPSREMPESQSKDAMVEATEKSMSPTAAPKPQPLKPILKEPHFEMPSKEEESTTESSTVATGAAATSLSGEEKEDVLSPAAQSAAATSTEAAAPTTAVQG